MQRDELYSLISALPAYVWLIYLQSRTVWHDMIGKHCPIFGVNREVIFICPYISLICAYGVVKFSWDLAADFFFLMVVFPGDEI